MATMRIVGMVNGDPSPYDGQYVAEFDPAPEWAKPGEALLRTTPDREQALHAPAGELMALWKTVDPRQPVRQDGKPNRPLTLFSVTFESD